MRKITRKLVTVVLSAVLLAVGLTGCSGSKSGTSDSGSDGTTAAPSEAASGSTDYLNYTKADLEGITLSVTLAKGWEKDAMYELFDKYTKEYGVEFDVQVLPDDTASDVIKTMFASGELPDIIMNSASPAELTYMQASENLVDITNEPWVNQIANLNSFVGVDGKLYGIPLAAQDYWGFAANKDVLASVGLQVPTSKEELLNCFKVLKENGIQPFYFGAKDAWLCGNITSSGIYAATQADSDLVNKLNTNQLGYADVDSFINCLTDIQDWNKEGYLGKNTMADSWDGEFDAVANDKCGFAIGIVSWLTEIDKLYPGTSDKIELIPYYIGDNDTIYSATSSQYYIVKSGKHVDVVKHFFNYAAQQENLQAYFDSLGGISPFKDITANNMPTAAEELNQKISEGTYKTHVSHNSIVQGQDWDNLCTLMQECVMGTMTPKDVAAEYDKARRGVCQSLGMEGF